VEVVPDVRRPGDGGIVEVRARAGDEVAQVAALPWVPERLLFGVSEMMDLEAAPQQAYAEQLPRILEALCAAFEPGKVHLLAGHLFVSGARVGGGERELTIGQLFAVSAATLPTSPQYIALGHVHRPQPVPASPVPARYAGSLLQLDFGEIDQTKSVTIVDVEPGRPAETRERPISGGRRLLDVRGTLDELRAAEVDADSFLRVILVCDGPSPGLADEVREFLPNAVEVRLEYQREDADQRAAELRRMTPRELFARYHRERHGADADDRLMQLFDELLEEVTGAPAAA
jgi:exonuclease SbcD